MNFKNIIKKYNNRNNGIISSDNVLHEMDAIVLLATSDALFDFNGIMISDVMTYGETKGYDIDKIIFLTSYDIEFTSENRSVEKVDTNVLRTVKNYKMKSDSKISIVEEDGKTVARVFMGSWVSLDKR